MSINAINGVSLYEYYYTINQDNKKKKASPIAEEMKKYGLTPTDDEQLNIAMLQRAKNASNQDDSKEKETDYSKRPWADLMYQLNLNFNPDPKDDISDIKDELSNLIKGVADDELTKEVNDLKNYIENLYITFAENSQNTHNLNNILGNQLNNMSMLNQVNLL